MSLGDPRGQLEIRMWNSAEGLRLEDTSGRNSLRNMSQSHGRG